MCGIVGFITAEEKTGQKARLNYLAQSLIVDVLRGEDSTGVLYGYGMRAGQQSGYFKEPVAGLDFVNGALFNDHLGTANNSVLKYAVGHNRAATLGSVTQRNAHPFRHDDVTGVHNGTIRGGMHLLPISLPKSGVTVDSDCVMMNLNHVDPDEAASKVIANINGAYMLIWYDNRDGSLNLVRNDTRTFHIAQAYDEDTLLFSSESGALEWIARRTGFKTNDVHFLKPHQQLKFTEANGLVPEVIAIDVPKQQVYTGKTSATPGGAGTKPGKSVTRHYPVAGNKIQIGGRPQEVPMILQEQLLDLDLAVEDRLTFVPQAKQSEETLRSTTAARFVSGWVDSQGLNAVCYRVEKPLVDKSFNQAWMVRPVGVKFSEQKAGTVPILVCEVVTSQAPAKETLTLQGDKKNSSPISTEDSPKAAPDGYLGPEGSVLSLTQWIDATRGGCVSCGIQLTTEDADGLRWDLVTHEPQCEKCGRDDDDAIAQLAAGQIAYYH